MPATTRADIDRFLSCRRIAVIGVSHNRAHFSRVVWKAFLDRGYALVPVHPSVAEIDGAQCFRSVASISPAPEAALLLLPPVGAAAAASECADAGVRCVWAYRAIDPEPLRQRGVCVVSGECPLMFVPDTGGIHWLHGCVRQIFGSYPA